MPESNDDEDTSTIASPSRGQRAQRLALSGLAGLGLLTAPVLVSMAATGTADDVATTETSDNVLTALSQEAAAADRLSEESVNRALAAQQATTDEKESPATTTTTTSTTTTTEPPATTTTAGPVEEAAPPTSEPAPAPQAGGGGLGDPYYIGSWDHLAQCESGGDWSINTGNGFYGGLQFQMSSWQAVGGTGYPHEASREEQIARGQALWEIQGWGAWPACTASFGWR